MLSQQLRLLEKYDLVQRTVHPQFPPKVEYELTEFGKTLCRRVLERLEGMVGVIDSKVIAQSTSVFIAAAD